MKLFFLLPSILIFFSILGFSESFAEEKTWYLGEGLKKGDFFSYRICHIEHNNCSDFQIDFWIEKTILEGSEEKWEARTVVYDGKSVFPGTMILGKTFPEPTGGTDNLNLYQSLFKSSVAWLGAYSNPISQLEIPQKSFDSIYWPDQLNENKVQVSGSKNIQIEAGTFKTYKVTWQVPNAKSIIWVLDDFPFPIKADTWLHVSEGSPPQEFKFELLNYTENVTEYPNSEGNISVTLEPARLFPEKNTKQILTVDVPLTIFGENLNQNLFVDLKILKENKIISRSLHEDADGKFSIFLRSQENPCEEIDLWKCTKYNPYKTTHGGYATLGDSEILSPVFGKPGKFEVNLIFYPNYNMARPVTQVIRDSPTVYSFHFNILEGTNEIVGNEKQLTIKSLSELKDENELFLTGTILSVNNANETMTQYDIQIEDHYPTTKSLDSIIGFMDKKYETSRQYFQQGDYVWLFLNSSKNIISPYSFKLDDDCEDFLNSELRPLINPIPPYFHHPADNARIANMDGWTVSHLIPNNQYKVVHTTLPTLMDYQELKITTSHFDDIISEKVIKRSITPCTRNQVEWDFTPTNLGEYTIAIVPKDSIFEQKIKLE